jgi:hypothetical protein
MTGPHLEENALVGLVACGTGSREWREAQPHLDGCPECRAALVAAVQARSLATATGAVADLELTTQASRQPSLSGEAPSLLGAHFHDRYRIDQELGRGGMGVVYRAWDERLGRAIALKVASRPAVAQFRERLLREARALAAVSHPRVVKVHDVGEHEGQLYLAMELIDGLTLERFVAQHRPPPEELLRLAREIGHGLSALHAAGLVHRDVKPANIMVDRRGAPYVMDLGLARLGDVELPAMETGETTATQAGAVLGTLGYMAPEQVRGELAGPAADQFSLCVTLCECLEGQRPFSSSDYAAWRLGHLSAPVARKVQGVPGHVSRAIARGLQLEPSKRWPSVHALVEALSARPYRRVKQGAAAALGASALLALAMLGPKAFARRECARRAERVHRAWNAQAHAQLRGAVLDAAPGYPVEQLDAALGELDGRAESLALREEQLCLEALDGRIDAGAAQAQQVCLDELLGSIRGLAGAFQKATARTALVLGSSVKELRAVSSCVGRPSDAVSSDTWSLEQRTRIAELSARARMGQPDEAVAGLREVAQAAGERGAKDVLTSAELARCSALMRSMRHDEQTVADVKAAVRLAESERLDRLAFTGRRMLIELLTVRRAPAATVADAVQDAHAALDRIGRPASEAARLALVEATDAMVHDRDPQALEKYDEAERLCAASDCTPEVRARIFAGRASTLAGIDPGERTVAVARRATALIEQIYGPESVEVFEPLVQQAKIAVTAELWEESLQVAERALALAEKYHLQPSGNIALAHSLRGISHHELGHFGPARADFDATEELYQHLPGAEVFARVINSSYLALLDVEERRPSALTRARAALELSKTAGNDQVVALPRLVLGLALGDTPEGREAFDWGRAVFVKASDSTTVRWIDRERARIWPATRK